VIQQAWRVENAYAQISLSSAEACHISFVSSRSSRVFLSVLLIKRMGVTGLYFSTFYSSIQPNSISVRHYHNIFQPIFVQ
jgi:hypothetical protein